MRKLDNQGFTVVELTLSFIFVFTIAFSMYQLLFNYRVRQNEESIKSQLMDYSNEVTLAIQNDINEKTLKNIEYCKQGGTIIDRCLVLNFNDNTNKQLAVETGTTIYDGETYEINYITYGGIIYESSDAILLDFRPNYMLYNTYESDNLEDENIKVYKISIPIYHNDLEGDYGVEVVAVGYDYEEPEVTAGSVDDVNASTEESKNIAFYSETDNSLNFVNITSSLAVGDTYNGKKVTDIFVGIESASYTSELQVPWHSYREQIKRVEVNTTIKPKSMDFMFYNFANCSYFDVEKINTSQVVSMRGTFSFAGSSSSVTSLQIIGLENWNTSNVIDMSSMFNHTGNLVTTFSIGDLSGWDTSKVTDMSLMFQAAGQYATTFNLGNLKDWNTSKVIDVTAMFYWSGNEATTWYIGDLSSWNTSNITNMSYMFGRAGEYSTQFNLGNLGNWDVSNVKNMLLLFFCSGRKTNNYYIGDLSSWDVSNVTNMDSMFSGAGDSSTTFNLGNLGNWDTSNVTSMNALFAGGIKATTWYVGELSKWNVSKVTNMNSMFSEAGKNATSFNIGDISKWDTSNVTSMSYMFLSAGENATWSLNLSGWNVDKVTSYGNFNTNVESKVTAPTWKN